MPPKPKHTYVGTQFKVLPQKRKRVVSDVPLPIDIEVPAGWELRVSVVASPSKRPRVRPRGRPPGFDRIM